MGRLWINDANGNIETVERFDQAGVQYDDLHYHYEKSGTQLLRNRLYHLNETIDGGYGDIGVDATTFHPAHADVNQLNNYQYDELGNLIADKREEIANIEWTVSGKVKRITRTAGSTKPPLEFTYGADGQRISKTVGDPLNGGYREYYLRDAQGNIMAMYRHHLIPVPNTNPQEYEASLKVTERPVYGSSRLGSYTRQLELVGTTPPQYYPYTQPMQAPLKRYELTDHLGNVATVVTGRLLPLLGPGVQFQAEVVSAQGYEAFGALLPGRNYSSDNYRFGFNGKEKVDEVYGSTGNSYDFGARIYDPRVGRWLSLDPEASSYVNISPFAAFLDNPTIFIDPDGETVRLSPNMSPKERHKVFSSIQKLTNDKLTMVEQNDGSYLVQLQTRSQIQDAPLKTGTQLLRDLIDHDLTLDMDMFKPVSGDNDYLGPGSYNFATGYGEGENPNEYNGIGADQTIRLGSTHKTLVRKQDGTVGKELMPYEIMVAHELIHGLRGMNGGKKEHTYRQVKYTYKDENGDERIGEADREELETVGVRGYERSGSPSENAIRREQGVSVREKY